MQANRSVFVASIGLMLGILSSTSAVQPQVTLLNVSYDPTREVWRDINAASFPCMGSRRASSCPSINRTAVRAHRLAPSSTDWRPTWSRWRRISTPMPLAEAV